MTETGEALTMAAAIPVIPVLIAMAKNYISLDSKHVPPIALALAGAWGAALVLSDGWNGDVPTFIAEWLATGFAATGVQSVTRTYKPDPSKQPRKAEPLPERDG